MGLPIRTILWAGNNDQHNDHLHVEGSPPFTGTPPYQNPGMSPSVSTIYKALIAEFGTPAYFGDAAAEDADWTHMGWYNRRKIAGTQYWSQHAWANALDVGPYYGVKEQQKFYDFLMNYTDEEDDDVTPEQDQMLKDIHEVIGIARVTLGAVENVAVLKHTESNLSHYLRRVLPGATAALVQLDVDPEDVQALAAAIADSLNDELAQAVADELAARLEE